jgi:hypothetical protein
MSSALTRTAGKLIGPVLRLDCRPAERSGPSLARNRGEENRLKTAVAQFPQRETAQTQHVAALEAAPRAISALELHRAALDHDQSVIPLRFVIRTLEAGPTRSCRTAKFDDVRRPMKERRSLSSITGQADDQRGEDCGVERNDLHQSPLLDPKDVQRECPISESARYSESSGRCT